MLLFLFDHRPDVAVTFEGTSTSDAANSGIHLVGTATGAGMDDVAVEIKYVFRGGVGVPGGGRVPCILYGRLAYN
jgi:hypothetical protein